MKTTTGRAGMLPGVAARGSRALVVAVGLALAAGACDNNSVRVGDTPAEPRNLNATYFDRAVYLTWELSPQWDGEAFRIYGKRVTDANYFLIAEVTNCSGGLCSYADVNVEAGQTYEYYVAAVDPNSGIETASAFAVEVAVPQPIPPPVPNAVEAVALDDAVYLRWGAVSRGAGDFAFYRVYLEAAGGGVFLLGETDSEGFLDEVAENGLTYRYFVSAVDAQGHESGGSAVAEATPRPDFHNEWIYDYFDQPALSGFRFRSDGGIDPIVDGDAPSRHFRLETDAAGWWLVPNGETRIESQAYSTTELKCGVAADAECVDIHVASTNIADYTTFALELIPQSTYFLEVRGDDGLFHYGALRVEMLGPDQNGDNIMIFDWSYQLQPGNPNLEPISGVDVRIRTGGAQP